MSTAGEEEESLSSRIATTITRTIPTNISQANASIQTSASAMPEANYRSKWVLPQLLAAVAVALVVTVGAVVGFMIYRRRREAKKALNAEDEESDGMYYGSEPLSDVGHGGGSLEKGTGSGRAQSSTKPGKAAPNPVTTAAPPSTAPPKLPAPRLPTPLSLPSDFGGSVDSPDSIYSHYTPATAAVSESQSRQEVWAATGESRTRIVVTPPTPRYVKGQASARSQRSSGT
ncbi:hypothetical protein CC1G_10609 [Coprinopsis cinerea okayama7|uniref:Uncharacterized protein n=1 Tax=Coprinopsis cinerea (strain Okayama-7 / 130 / ATCC MYA-4618 / FGSC 9003) TaxID=240176 RepID=A8P8Q7_COPC7|nr:hypothetical protein CC1G_10609 [Coprinopsis cinerea okayama7\|eukprot:XP_001839616.1 hypothetical protein CC1G_10609 [Coprinopsis cinerea okayama7\